MEACKNCGTQFFYVKGPIICNKCNAQIKPKLKKYIIDHPNVNSIEVCTKLDITTQVLDEYIKDDVINIKVSDVQVNSNSKCKDCGSPINEGERYCKSCKRKKDLETLKQLGELYTSSNNQNNSKKSRGMYSDNIRHRL